MSSKSLDNIWIMASPGIAPTSKTKDLTTGLEAEGRSGSLPVLSKVDFDKRCAFWKTAGWVVLPNVHNDLYPLMLLFRNRGTKRYRNEQYIAPLLLFSRMTFLKQFITLENIATRLNLLIDTVILFIMLYQIFCGLFAFSGSIYHFHSTYLHNSS